MGRRQKSNDDEPKSWNHKLNEWLEAPWLHNQKFWLFMIRMSKYYQRICAASFSEEGCIIRQYLFYIWPDSGSSSPYLTKNVGGLPWMGCPLLVSYLARWSFSCLLRHLHWSSNKQRTQKYVLALFLLLQHFQVLRAHLFAAQGIPVA